MKFYKTRQEKGDLYTFTSDCLIEVTTSVDLTTFVIKGLIQLTGSE